MYRMLLTMCALSILSLGGCDSHAPAEPSADSADEWWDGISAGLADDGSALASTTFLGVPREEIVLDHCRTGFDVPLQETKGIVQIRTSEIGMGWGRPAGD